MIKAQYEDVTTRIPRTDDNFMRTYTGRCFWPLDPQAEDIDILDIAHHLALLNRFAGATAEPYSVAEHSLRVSQLVEKTVLERLGGGRITPMVRDAALWGLLHDATEAYLVDVPRPVKHSRGMAMYRLYEETLEKTIAQAFGLAMPVPPVIKEADNILLATEQRDLMKNARNSRGFERLPSTIFPMNWQDAERMFLKRFDYLTGKAVA
jgi:uncharacterized protein